MTQVSHYNRDGFLEKIEAYGGNENPPCKFREIIISNLSGRGDLNGTEVLYNCGIKFNEFPFSM
ncbi:MAG: hypothetical protein IPG02_17310 [Ignavibacteria bacterium]|nr:hypothetical protein [Ignavibacteria bacterium]